ncbi:malectin domain-containing carbohydrate-binding protein [Modicisalibacter zincidurans]|uniref:Malectin domain-containing protein n=1 Tax=Modicisalibacter zincidurans TaxID=1178777 RepID=A0ABP9RIQ8_9GAMM|nr:malectin domain-containing carbohydrate-binding protein [Halomonas zincidurans]
MVTNNFSKSSLDLNGIVSLAQPTALAWGPDGRLYVTEVNGSVKVLTVAFGDPTPGDASDVNSFYVTEAETLGLVKNIPNFNDDGSPAVSSGRQVTGIAVVQQYDVAGQAVTIGGKPAVTLYVTSSDSRIGAGADGNDTGLDTNSGTITRIDQIETGWSAVDIVRGLARSEENHALNGLEVVQEFDDAGNLTGQRLIVANGGNANNGAPSNNFGGQQETAYSAAILEIDLDQLNAMETLTDPLSGRQYIYDVPTLDDPTRDGNPDENDPFGGNDGLNGGKIDPDGPVQIYSAGYRNSYDVEVTEDGRVWTYDNGSNNSWGGRPIGEAGDDGGTVDYAQLANYIATNLNNGDGNSGDPINLEDWDPKNYDQFHEITRSDDLAGRTLSAGQGGAATYEWLDPDSGETLTLVYGGHPNPTRASGGQSGILFTPQNGVQNAFLLLSNVDKQGPDSSDYDAVIAWLAEVESNYDTLARGDLTGRVIGVTPGESYYITDVGKAYLTSDYPDGTTSINGEAVLGVGGMPVDFDDVVATLNPIESDYLEGGYTDGSVDSGKGSVNGLTEYTSTILDDPESGVKMSGAILAASLNQGTLTVMGRDADGSMQSVVGSSGQTLAQDRTVVDVSGAPLGLASIGDDLTAFEGEKAFQGSVWTTVYKQNGPLIEILQPNNGAVPLAGSEIIDPTDQDGDGVDHFNDPFEFSTDNGFDLGVGERVLLDFDTTQSPYPGTILDTGLMGAALDGVTPNRDAKTAEEGFDADQQEDGLYDLGGNIIPGGNAPIFQIKKVAGGTVVGTENSARDAMHVGIKPGPDVERLMMSSKIKNWIPAQTSGIKNGQLTGIMLSDGTQANYLRLVFGAVMIDGVLAAGFEVGYEIDDDYTKLTSVAAPELGNSDVASLDLYLEVDIGDSFAVKAGYQLDNADGITSLDLGNFTLPAGVLQDILTGSHTITDGDTTLPSGAAVGFLAETSAADAASESRLAAIDFYNLRIDALSNEIAADTAAEVGAEGTDGVDTIVYTGTDTDLAPLDDSVENFDGSGSSADFTVTGNSGDNILIAGSGANTFIGNGGADSIRGTFADIDGSVITDFMSDDRLVILDSVLEAGHIGYSTVNGVLTLTLTDPQTGETATLSLPGDQFAGFDPADGPSTFDVEQTEHGTQISYKIETLLYRVNAGAGTVAAIDGGMDWLGDTDSNFPYLAGNTADTYSNNMTNEQSEVDLAHLASDPVPWQLFVNERSDNDIASPKLEYAFPVTPGGNYTITLYYTENWAGIFDYGGDRIFDVEVEGRVPAVLSGINPLQEAIDIYGADASQQELLGVGFSRSYTVNVEDDVLNLAFNHGAQNPKINAIEIKQLGPGTVIPDDEPPVVQSITLEEPLDNDSPILATVVITDNAGIDPDSLDGNELVFTGIEPATVTLAPGGDAITISDDGKTVTVNYELTPPADTNSWSDGFYTVGVAADSYQDKAGNGVAAYETDFTIGSAPDALLALDFETVGEPLDEGGFDDVLGGVSDAAMITQIIGGELVVNTSNGDIIKGQSVNDFIKYVDLSDDVLNEIRIASRFDNPFPAALAAQGLATDTIPNYAQQGLVFGLGSQGNNELVKLVFGGAGGNMVQIWSNPTGKSDPEGVNSVYELGDLLNDASLGLSDVAAVEMTLVIDKAAGTVTPEVTFLGSGGAILGGLRATPSAGFVTAQAETLPGAVLANLTDSAAATAVGVTSNDYGTLGSFEASWEYLNVTSPDATGDPGGGDPALIAISDAANATESGDTGTTALTFLLSANADVDATLDVTYSTNGGATSRTQTVIFTDGVGELTIDVANDDVDDGPDTVTVALIDIAGEQYAVDPNADTASGSVNEDDRTPEPPADGVYFALDFETVGEPLDEGGFDDVLGGVSDAAMITQIIDGELVVNTSNGDIIKGQSVNDFIKYVDLSDDVLNEIRIASRFDNPFPAALAAQGLATDTIPNYAQQGLVFGLGSQGNNELVKLVFGGHKGNAIQIWSNPDSSGGIDTDYKLDDLLNDANLGLSDVAAVEMTLVIDKASGTATPEVTFLGSDGAILGGLRATPSAGFVTAQAEALPGAVLANLTEPAAATAVGVTSNDYGTLGSYEASWEYLNLTSPDATGDPALIDAEQIFAGASVETPDTYEAGAVGSATVTVTLGSDVQESNYGNNSFKVTNTGDKKIAAVFFDVRTALYGDSVFDPDGKGGDTAFKTWAVNSGGGTGALQPSGYEHYFLPGADPEPTDPDNNGGYRGALLKFSATNDGGFTQGEVVGFSGDMDPNSIAGMEKDGAAGVDTDSVPDWDVGGVSGAEMIGSMAYIMFTDASVASAQLMGDGSQSGAQARVTEAPQNQQASLSVNGVASGEAGSYGGEVPVVLVSGPAGAWVRVIMTKGHQPVANTTDSLADIVDWRLSGEDFPVNNAAEFQFVDVQLGADGTADVSDQFTYSQFLNGTASFPGDDTLPLGFVAAVIEDPTTSRGFALGPVTEPVYLESNGMPVSESMTTSSTATAPEIIGESGNVSLSQVDGETWTSVTFGEPLADPAVVMGPLTNNDGEPVTVRVNNVTDTGFEFQIDEWDYLDGIHEQESLSWLAIESGTHTLDNGMTVAAGKGQVSAEAQTFGFGTDFTGTPVVLAQTLSVNDASAVVHRVDAVSGSGFDLRLQSEEAAAVPHGTESFGWIAIDEGAAEGLLAGRTGQQVGDAPFEIPFGTSLDDIAFLAGMQTLNDADPATVRAQAIGADGATIFIEEEQSGDSEMEHISEDVGFVGINAGQIVNEIA